MTLGNCAPARRQIKKRYDEQVAEYAERSARIRPRPSTALVEERGRRRRNFADPAEVLMTATVPGPGSGSGATDPDFLLARLGTADLPSDVHRQRTRSVSPRGPVAVDRPRRAGHHPPRRGRRGRHRRQPESAGRSRWVIGQTAVLHSPADVDMVLLADSELRRDWDWVRWLPHAALRRR